MQAQLCSNILLPSALEEGIYSLECQETLALGGRNSTHEELKSSLRRKRENDDPSNGYKDHEDESKEDRHRHFDEEMTTRRRHPKRSPICSQQSETVLALAIALPLLAMGVVKEEI